MSTFKIYNLFALFEIAFAAALLILFTSIYVHNYKLILEYICKLTKRKRGTWLGQNKREIAGPCCRFL
ncbi:hypothetical protein DsansV1_C20g0164091 [Dioscorea sansibarensis]